MKKRFMSILLALCMMLTLLPATAEAAIIVSDIKDGWYYLRVMGNYLNFDANGNEELRDKTNILEGNPKFLVRNRGTTGVTLETADGRLLGVNIPEYKFDRLNAKNEQGGLYYAAKFHRNHRNCYGYCSMGNLYAAQTGST